MRVKLRDEYLEKWVRQQDILFALYNMDLIDDDGTTNVLTYLKRYYEQRLR